MIKVTLDLTAEQKVAIQPLTDAMTEAIGGVLGQCFVIPTDSRYGQVDLYYMTREQHAIIDAAIIKALKLERGNYDAIS